MADGTDPEPEDDGKANPESVYNVLKAGDYVRLKVDKQDEPLWCRVLYDKKYNEENETNYGIQLIALVPTEYIKLGYEDPRIETDAPEDIKNLGTSTGEERFKRSQWSYNNIIGTLDKTAKTYTGPNIKSARSWSTKPDDPTYVETKFYTPTSDEEWCKELIMQFREYTSYDYDRDQMNKLGIPWCNYPWGGYGYDTYYDEHNDGYR